jgi:hypothetical protein
LSYIARAFTGKDRDLPNAIRKELGSIKTEANRKDKLEEIDNFIKEAEASEFNQIMKLPPELKPGELAMPGSDLFNKRMKYINKKTHNNHGQVGRGLVGGLPGAIITHINAKDGTIGKYIAELKRVRAEIVALKLSK